MIDRRTAFGIILLTVIGMGLLLQLLLRTEYRNSQKALERRGYHFTNLLALHTIDAFRNDRRNYLLKSFLEHPLFKDLAYFYIHGLEGAPVIALNPSDHASQLPVEVRNNALASQVYVQQFFTIDDQTQIFEFSKPIFEGGIKTGTIRLGLYKPTMTIMSIERISLLGMLAFFIFAGAIIAYHGFSKTLFALSKLKTSLLEEQPNQHHAINIVGSNPADIEQDLSNALRQFKTHLGSVEEKNIKLTSHIGVIQYENAQISRILDTIQLGIIITDIQSNIVHVNKYVLNLLGLKQSEVLDRPLEDILNHSDALDHIAAQIPTQLTDDNPGIDIEWPDLAPGETFRLSCSFFVDCQDRSSGQMLLIRNITSEKTLQQATKDFTAHLSHELLTPLSTLQSYSEMLVDDEIEDNETRNEFYNTIHEETIRLSRLIKDILCFSKLENGNLSIEKSLVRSDWLFNDSLSAITGSAKKKNITIDKILPDNVPSLIGDKEQLKGAIINILGNAVKYTPGGGTIRFELRENGEMVIFEITDTGCGISQQELPHIFKKFFRSEHSAIADQPGTGLGLAIAQEIVTLHDGKIEVDSDLGQGSKFNIKLPKEEYYIGKEH